MSLKPPPVMSSDATSLSGSLVRTMRYSETELKKRNRRAGTSGELSIIYEKKLLMLILHRALKEGYDFTLDTNIEGAGSFDDVVFTYKEKDGIEQRIYLQAKHKENRHKKIQYDDLLKSGIDDFALYRYFIDYIKTIRYFDEKTKIRSKYFIIYTNIDFNCPRTDDKELRIHKKSEDAYFIFRKLDLSKHKPLDIFSTVDSFYQFSDSNENGEDEKTRVIKVLRNKLRDIDEQKEMPMLTKVPEYELESKLEGFLSTLVLAVCQHSEIKLGNQIKEEIKQTHSDSLNQDHINFIFEYALNEIGQWRARSRAHPLTEKNDFFRQGEEKLLTMYPTLMYEKDLSNINLRFKSEMYEQFSDFIASRKGLWIIYTESSWLNSLVIYQALNEVTLKKVIGKNYANHNHLFLHWIVLLKGYNFLTTFKAKEPSLLITVCESTDPKNPKTPDIAKEILNIISENNFVQIIVLAPKNHELAKHLKQKSISAYDGKYEIEFGHLTLESQEICLKTKKINFQGKNEQFSIQQLFGLEGKTEEMLIKLNFNIPELETLLKSPVVEIGNPQINLCHLETMHFKKHRRIEKEQLMSAFEENPEDIFAFVGEENEVKSFLKLDPKQMLILFRRGLSSVNGRFILLQEGQEEEQFKHLCYQADKADTNVSQPAIHLLKILGQQCLWTQTFSRDFYMKRRFLPVVVDAKKIKEKLVEEPSFDFIVFSGTNEEALLNLLMINKNEKINFRNIAVFPEKAAAQEMFDNFDSDFLQNGKSIHWLKINEIEGQKQLQWYRSQGDVCRLRELLVEEGEVKTPLTEASLTVSTAQAIVLADDSGMGKTTTLTCMVGLMQKEKPQSWVMKIDLNEHQAVLVSKQIKTKEDLVNLLSNIDDKLDNPLAHRILMHQLTCPGCVILLCDGFDEVKSETQDALLALFDFLKKETAATVWVTTHRHDQRKLEGCLSVLAHPFMPIDKEEQIDFLSRFWATTLRLAGKIPGISILKRYAKDIIEAVERSIQTYKTDEFISIPLRTRMLAEIHQEVVEKVLLENKPFPEFLKAVEHLKIENIFEKFIYKKCSYFSAKDDTGKRIQDESNSLESYIRAYGILAVQKLFDPPFIRYKKIKYSLDILSQIGFIKGNEEPVNFIHRTFEEYFAAKWLAEEAKNFEVKKFLAVQLFKKESGVVRCFFNHFILQELQIHRAVLESDVSALQELLCENSDIAITDDIGRTALHLAAEEGRCEMIEYLPKEEDFRLSRDQLGRTALHYAACFGYDTVVNLLLKNYVNVDVNDHIFRTPLHFDAVVGNSIFNISKNTISDLMKIVNVQDEAGKTSLYYAVDNEYWDTACNLLLYGADVSVLTIKEKRKLLYFAANQTHRFDARQRHRLDPIVGLLSIHAPEVILELSEKDEYLRFLSFFFMHGHTKVIDVLLRSIENEERRLNVMFSVLYLHSSFSHSHLSLLEYLSCINSSNKYLFSDTDYLKTVKYFFEQYTKLGIDLDFDEVNSLLSIATNHGFIETFKYLYEYGVNKKSNLSFGISINNDKKFQDKKKYVISLFSNVQNLNSDNPWLRNLISACCENFGWTELHLAAMNKNVNVEQICNKNSGEDFLDLSVCENINKKDADGFTPLAFAAVIGGRSKFIESFFVALKKRGFEDTKQLHKIVNAKNNIDGAVPLHWVIFNRDIESARVLLEYINDIGFNRDQLFNIVNSHDFSGLNPIYHTYCIGNTENTAELLKLLFKYIKLFNFSSQQCMDILKGSGTLLYDIIFHGYEKEALALLSGIQNLPLEDNHRSEIISTHYKERNNNTPLHGAASSGYCYEIILSLLKNGAVFNAYNSAQETPLDIFIETKAESESYKRTDFLLRSVTRLFELIVDKQVTAKLDELKERLDKIKKETWIDPESILNARNTARRTLLDLSKYKEISNLLEGLRGNLKKETVNERSNQVVKN